MLEQNQEAHDEVTQSLEGQKSQLQAAQAEIAALKVGITS